jgi:hypothetical protein
MRKFPVFVLLIFTLLLGCQKREQAAIQIDDIYITPQEFQQAYQTQSNIPPEEFLDQYISKKIILREAERLGLDRDPQFLADIQQYWEQGLLKRILTKKRDEETPQISNEEIARYYQENRNKLFVLKSLEESKDEIKSFILREKQNQALNQWVEDAKKKAYIHIDHAALGISKGKEKP